MHHLGSKFYMFTSFIQQKAHTYLHDLQHFLPGNGSILVFVIKLKWPAQLLHCWAFDEHADGNDILPEINHPILKKSNLIQTHWPLSNFDTFHLHLRTVWGPKVSGSHFLTPLLSSVRNICFAYSADSWPTVPSQKCLWNSWRVISPLGHSLMNFLR